MFFQSLGGRQGSQQAHSQGCIPPPDFVCLDVQYQICSKFMKKASEQIYQKEIELIQSTSKFMDKMQDLMIQKDISSTQESVSFDNFFEDDDPFTQPSKSRLLLRKSKSNGSLRRTESGLTEALREIEKKCSQKTSSMLSNLALEFKKLKQKLASSEKFQKEVKRLELRLNSSQEQLLMYVQFYSRSRKRVSDLQKESKTQCEQISSLRKKLKQASDQVKSTSLTLTKSSAHLQTSQSVVPGDRLRRFLQQKEVHIFKKEKQIKSIQDRIQQSLQGVLGDSSCGKCCEMMRRIKDSIMRYRSFLEEEVGAAQQCYSSIKKHFY